MLLYILFYGISLLKPYKANVLMPDEGPLIETNSGVIVGKTFNVLNTDVAAFEGIPFAEPPVGEKRFQKPYPVQKWEGKYFAQEKPSACMQFSRRTFLWTPVGLNKSEDCLYLNVWLPMRNDVDPNEKLPVMVWIYGGGYSIGSASMSVYDGKALAARGNVIVVSMNYRAGVFGFFNGGIEEAPGNVGLYDQLLALKWINENIQFFGGDPSSITLFGESSGATSIAFLIISSLTKGLFQKAIMESGTSYSAILNEEVSHSLLRANKFASVVGCADNNTNVSIQPLEVIKCLKNKDALELAKIEDTFISKYSVYFQPFFGQTCDGCNDILPNSPTEVSQSGNFQQIPILLGDTENEGPIFLNYMMPEVFSMNKEPSLNLTQAKDVIEYLFSFVPGIHSDKVLDYYVNEITENKYDLPKAISSAIGDFMFNCPSLFFAEDSEDSYMYWMNHTSAKTNDSKWVGMTHIYDVPYVFGVPLLDTQTYSKEDAMFSENIIKIWTTFAREGHPFGKEGIQKWPRFSSDSATSYKLSSNNDGITPFPRKSVCEFWRPYLQLNKNKPRVYI